MGRGEGAKGGGEIWDPLSEGKMRAGGGMGEVGLTVDLHVRVEGLQEVHHRPLRRQSHRPAAT